MFIINIALLLIQAPSIYTISSARFYVDICLDALSTLAIMHLKSLLRNTPSKQLKALSYSLK